MGAALRVALAMAKDALPVYLICGGLVSHDVRGMQEKVYQELVRSQMAAAPGVGATPIHTIEVFPMPPPPKDVTDPAAQLNGAAADSKAAAAATAAPADRGGAGSSSSNNNKALRLTVNSETGGAAEVEEEKEVSAARAAAAQVTLEDVTESGADVFERLQEACVGRRVRLLDVFKEVDKDTDMRLSSGELFRLVKFLLPGATPAQLRYLQLMLDDDGDRLISYKELNGALRASLRAGIRQPLAQTLELSLLIHKLAIFFVLRGCSVDELFDSFDANKSGFWEQGEQVVVLKELLPGLTAEERAKMHAALQVVDTNNDKRISREELTRVFEMGGTSEAVVLASEASALDKAAARNLMELLDGSFADAGRLREAQRADHPLSVLLDQVCSVSGGTSRRIDLGHGRSEAEHVDMSALYKTRDGLSFDLKAISDFERSYGEALNRVVAEAKARAEAREAARREAEAKAPKLGEMDRDKRLKILMEKLPDYSHVPSRLM